MENSSPPNSLIVVLENATLETARLNKTGAYTLLNADDHENLIRRAGGDPKDYRPDIVHQTLLVLLDSPLAKSGRLQIYIHTMKNVLIHVSSHLRIPRTYKQFSLLMTQLLHARKVKAAQGQQTLMRVIKNPLTQHLPVGSPKIGLSVEGQLENIQEYIADQGKKFTSTDNNEPPLSPVFIIGACTDGHPGRDCGYNDTVISISNYRLSAAATAARLTCAFEQLWEIL